jgi:hypothetical protein
MFLYLDFTMADVAQSYRSMVDWGGGLLVAFTTLKSHVLVSSATLRKSNMFAEVLTGVKTSRDSRP